MEPSKKSKAMEELLEKTFKRTSRIRANTCVSCKGPATTFKDSLSRKEYRISGLCQVCQDKVFGGEEC